MVEDKKTILVTGGAGFLGSHLCRKYIEEGHTVICVDNLQTTGSMRNIEKLLSNPRFSFVRHDIIESLPKMPRVDWIFNFACSGSYTSYQFNPVHTMRTNTEGMRNMLELARINRARILQASTSEIYGDPLEIPQKETYRGNVNILGPRACYDEGKRAAETLCMDYWREHGVDVKIIRIFNTYGPGMDVNDGRAVSNFVTAALKGEDLVLYGDGSTTRSYQYVDDLVEGIDRMMRKEDFTGPVNLGNPGEVTTRSLAEKVVALTQSSSKVVSDKPATDDPQRRCPDISLAKEKLGWEPRVSLDEGLEKTIAYFQLAAPHERRVLVFTPTFHPVEGVAESALRDLMSKMSELHFDVITARFTSEKSGLSLPNVTVHRLGFGVKFDKFLLPLLGFLKAWKLSRAYRYEFIWSVMASYAGVAAVLSKKMNPELPFLITLADQRIGEGRARRFNWLVRLILSRADQVIVSDASQEARALELTPDAHLARSVGGGEALRNQVRFLYHAALNERNRKIARPK